MSMTCDRIRPLLSGYHDDALKPRERARVRAHVASCPVCRATLEGYDRLYACLRTAAPAVPADLRRNVYARIAEMEARKRFGPSLGPPLLRTLRTAGGTAGLLAVLAALALAIMHETNISQTHGPQVAVALEPAVAGTAVSGMLGAARRGQGAILRLPAGEQTAVAPVRSALAGSAALAIARGHKSGNAVSVPFKVLRADRSGAPRAVVLGYAMVAPQATVKRVVAGTPSPVPTIPPGDGLVYLHLDTYKPFLPYAQGGGNARAEVYWHAFAAGARPQLLVAPAVPTKQLFTNVTVGRDGRTVAYSALGTGQYGGIFSFPLDDPRPRRLLSIQNPTPPNQGGPVHYVQQVSPTTDGRLLYTLIASSASAGGPLVSVNITTTQGTRVVAANSQPWYPWSDYAVSPDQSRIAWVQHPTGELGFGTLYVVTLGAHPVTQTIGSGAHPVWSPDGRSLLYKSNSPEGLWVWSPGGGYKRLANLHPPGQPFINTFTWSPDGRFVAYVVSDPRPGGSSEVRLADPETGYSWPVFTDAWIGAIAWAHGPVAVPVATATPVPTATAARAALPATTATRAGAGTGTRMVGPARGTAPARPAVPYYSNTASPLATLRSYYNAVNRHEYRRAYSYLAFLPGDHPNFGVFAGGYRDTRSATLTRLEPAPYQNAANYHATTCVGFALSARQTNGKQVRYGGWYMLESTTGQNPRFTGWKIVMSSSYSVSGGHAVVPAQGACTTARRYGAATGTGMEAGTPAS